jgi:hypothetical protein
MSANPAAAAWTPPPPRDRWGPGRVVALVLGLLLLLPALGLLLGGGVLLWADQSQRTKDGFLLSPTGEVSAPGYAVVSDRIDLSTSGDWVPVSAALGTVRVQATANGPDLFLGVGPSAQVADYMRGVQRTVIDDLGNDGAVQGSDVPGNAPSGPPQAQTFWADQVAGGGRQQLSWDPSEGNWTFVVMNADGSAAVDADLRVGAEVPALTGLAWGMLAGGVVLAGIAALVIVLAVRRRSTPYPQQGQYQPAQAPTGPSGWQPPAPRTAPNPEPTRESSQDTST